VAKSAGLSLEKVKSYDGLIVRRSKLIAPRAEVLEVSRVLATGLFCFFGIG